MLITSLVWLESTFFDSSETPYWDVTQLERPRVDNFFFESA